MTFLKSLALAVLVGFFQGAVEISWSFGGPCPDLLLLTVIWLGVKGRTSEALVIGFVGGLAVDGVAYFQPVGIRSLLLVMVAYLPEWAHFVLLPENRATGFLLVATATFLQQVLLLTIVQTLEPGGIWGGRAVWGVTVSLALNLVGWGLWTSLFSLSRESGGAT